MTATRNTKPRQLTGVVTSTKADKTITVEVARTYKHPKYGKYVRRNKKYMAHDEKNAAGVGDKVIVVGTRPLSKNKRWRLLEITQRSAHPSEGEISGGASPEGNAGGEA